MKKGFTLIELLAVILILGIIALIAIPTVNNILQESRQGAFLRTSENVLNAIINNCNVDKIKNNDPIMLYEINNKKLNNKLDIKGELPKNGIVKLNYNCEVEIANFNTDNNSATYVNEKIEAVDYKTIFPSYKTGTDDEVSIVYFNPVTGARCSKDEYTESLSLNENKEGCMRWYAIENSGSDKSTVNLILDHNSTKHVEWSIDGNNTNGPVTALQNLKNTTMIWEGVTSRSDKYQGKSYEIDYTGYKARLITTKEITDIINMTNFDITKDNFETIFYFDEKKKMTTWENSPVDKNNKSNYAWIFDYTDCENFGCKNIDTTNRGYYTSDASYDANTYAWYVREEGFFECVWVDSNNWAGIRPVITVEKEKLKY